MNRDYFNAKTSEGSNLGIHLDKKVWRFHNATKNVEEEEENSVDLEKVNVVTIPKKDHRLNVCIKAKEKELKAFKKFQIYKEVTDYGQEKLSSRWVMTDKSNGKRTKLKARLLC